MEISGRFTCFSTTQIYFYKMGYINYGNDNNNFREFLQFYVVKSLNVIQYGWMMWERLCVNVDLRLRGCGVKKVRKVCCAKCYTLIWIVFGVFTLEINITKNFLHQNLLTLNRRLISMVAMLPIIELLRTEYIVLRNYMGIRF